MTLLDNSTGCQQVQFVNAYQQSDCDPCAIPNGTEYIGGERTCDLPNNSYTYNFFAEADNVTVNVGQIQNSSAVEYTVTNIPFAADLSITLTRSGNPCERIENVAALTEAECNPCLSVNVDAPQSNGDQVGCAGSPRHCCP